MTLPGFCFDGTERERERERESAHTHTHTHTHRAKRLGFGEAITTGSHPRDICELVSLALLNSHFRVEVVGRTLAFNVWCTCTMRHDCLVVGTSAGNKEVTLHRPSRCLRNVAHR